MAGRTAASSKRFFARLAGFMFLFYIATGITSMVLFKQASGGAEGTAAKLASIAQHGTMVRVTALLYLVTFFDAVALAVALYALTRDEDHDLAMLAMCCRVGEGVLGAASAISMLGLLSVATASTAAGVADAAGAQALGGLLLRQDESGFLIGGSCFAVGSTIFAYLFLRARTIPTWLAWLGVLSSLLVVVALPLQMVDFLHAPVTGLIWAPVFVFEVTLGLWLLIKGVAAPALEERAAPLVAAPR